MYYKSDQSNLSKIYELNNKAQIDEVSVYSWRNRG